MRPLSTLVAVFVLFAGTALAQENRGAGRADEEAKALALRVHRQAAAIDKLPRFFYQARNRVSEIDTMRDVKGRSIDLLKTALDAPVREEDLNNVTIQVFAWDDTHFLYGKQLLQAGISDHESENHRFGTQTQAWHRYQRDDKPATFVLANTKRIWESLQWPALGYMEVTPHQFWWGDTTQGRGKTNSSVPAEAVSYRHVGAEQFGGETCDVVESTGRRERLWMGRKSGRLRGVLDYIYQGRREPPFHETAIVKETAGRTFSSQDEFRKWAEDLTPARKTELEIAYSETYFESNARPGSLARFDDYREVAPGVWIPFRVEQSRASSYKEPKGQYHDYVRGELAVEEVKTDVDLSKTITGLMPKEGERIQDQRYWPVWVNYDYRADRTREEVLKLVSDRQQEIAASAVRFEQVTKPVEAMVGQPAPELPGEGWIGGERPKLDGTPHLIHFWATWCGPCKGDLPLLRKLAAGGATVIGIHPPGTPPDEVKKRIAEEELDYPTLLVSSEGDADDLAGYPVKLYPYCVLVDGKGDVAAHGVLGSELLGQFGDLRKDAEAKSVK